MNLSSEIDLHIHSTFSDGVYRPAEIVDLAAAQGLAAMGPEPAIEQETHQ